MNYSYILLFLMQTTVYADEIANLLQLSLEELLNVEVISVSKQLEPVAEAPATIYVITEEQIRKLGLRDLSQALNLLPGVDGLDNDFFLQGGQRGFSGSFSQSLILINGREMNNLIAGETFISNQFRTHNVKQIEVIAGPAAAMYGANAVGGLINIITKRDVSGVELQFGIGSFNDKSLSAVFGYQNHNTEISGSIAYYSTQGDDFSQQLSNVDIISPQAENNTYRHLPRDYGYSNPSSSLPISLYIRHEGAFAGLEYYKNISGRGTASIQWDYHLSEDYRELFMPYFGYEQQLSEKLYLNFEYRNYWEKFWGNHTESSGGIENPFTGEMLYDNISLDDINVYRGFYSNQRSRGSQKHVANMEAKYNWLYNHSTIAGLNYQYSDIVSAQWSRTTGKHPILTADNYQPIFKNYKWSIYLQDQSRWLDENILLTLGARMVNHQRYGRKILPRYGLVYKPNSDSIIKALYARSFREPTVFELNANPNIKPMLMDTYELAWHQYFGAHIKNEAVLFFNRANNIITPSDVIAFDNSGSFASRGLENQLNFNYQAVHGFISYTYMDKIKYDIPKHKFGWGLIYDLNRANSIGISGHYRSGLDTEYQNSSYSIKPYSVWDITWRMADLGISLSINNLFNRDYYHPEPRGADILQHPQPKRHFWLQFEHKF
jgi:outer membrane receptor protein involved in Fe transport